MTIIHYICAISKKIMAVFYKGTKYAAGFFRKKEVSGYFRGNKIFPDGGDAAILGVYLVLYDLPEGYTGSNQLEYIPACGGKSSQCVVRFRYTDENGEKHYDSVTANYIEGEISSESKYFTESGITNVGTRHISFIANGEEFNNYEVVINQEANVVTKTPKSEPSKPLKEDAWYYYTPVIKSFSYTGYGLLASGGEATPQFVVSVTKIESRYLITEKTWNDYQSTALEEAGFAPKQVDVMGGIEEWVDISAPVTTEYTDTNSGEVVIKFDASNLISAATLQSYDTGVIAINSMGTTPYPDGRTIGNAKIIVNVPRIKTGEQSRVESSIALSQGANTSTEDWRVTPAFTSAEYGWERPVITSISCALVGASGSPAKVIVGYSQNRYKYQYSISEQRNLYYVWTSGAEENTGMFTGGEKTLVSKTVSSTITSGGSLAFGGSALNSSGATIDSSGWVTGVSLYRTVTEERDIFEAWATVTANGLTSVKNYVKVRQHYNHQYTENMSEGKAVTTIEYDYSSPVVTLKYQTGAGEESYKVTARGGSLYPSIKATQTSRSRSHTVGPTTWVWNYWDADPDGVETDKKTADYYSAWVDGQTYETTSLSDVIQWYGDEKKNGATVASSDGTVSVPSLGTTEFSEGNVLKVVATVRMNGKTANGYCYISQGSNTKSISSSELTGIYGLSLKKLDGSEVLITEELSYSAQGLYLIVEGKRTIRYLWSSGSTSTANESVANAKAESVTSSKTAMLTVGSYDATRGYALMLTSNSSKTEARSVVVTVKLGIDTVTRTIYQGVNTAVVYDKNYFKFKFVKTSNFTTAEGDILPVGDIVLIRSNKPGNVGYVVNYTITYEVYGGQTYTKTGTVTLTSDMTEGSEAVTVARHLVSPLVSSYSDY